MSVTPTTIVEGFSISHAAILNGVSGLEEPFGDVYGVRDGSIEPDVDSYDNTGDDSILSVWNWFNYANVNIVAGYVPFRTISLITGDVMTSSGTGSVSQYQIDMWSQTSLNVAPKPMLIRVPSKDSLGNPRFLDFMLYRVQFNPITFTGPTYKEGLVINYGGKALISSVDEKGATLAGGKRVIGRLVSIPSP
jgi:hypothetical protein